MAKNEKTTVGLTKQLTPEEAAVWKANWAKKTVWHGSRTCDFCGKEIKEESEYLYDARTVFGPWAKMCDSCFILKGNGRLGTGHGQKYRMTKGELIKVEG